MIDMSPKFVKRKTESMIQNELAMHWPLGHRASITSGVSAVDWWLHINTVSSSDSLRISSPDSITVMVTQMVLTIEVIITTMILLLVIIIRQIYFFNYVYYNDSQT